MALNTSPQRHHQYSPPRASPLRQSSNASTSSSAYSSVYSGYSHPSVASYASTLNSIDSTPPPSFPIAHKRGRSETEMAGDQPYRSSREASPTATYKSMRQSLRPLPQPPSAAPPPSFKASPTKLDSEGDRRRDSRSSPTPMPPAARHNHSVSASLNRSNSMRPRCQYAEPPHTGLQSNTFAPPDLNELSHSSTAQLRNLSKFTQHSSDEGFSIASDVPSVVGLHNRRQLKRNDSVRALGRGQAAAVTSVGSQWLGSQWMEQQRQFLQAYEYLCHIGEAKEWIEDVIQKPIPPIVTLEEALRDGVTLAEIVQALHPHRVVRIFQHPKLQYRHSDNIAIFFRFLNEVELPELFRFELIDLYEKKNTPKVIYCIHALSWLLYRNGMVNFRIGNLVGQLQFEHHELEEVQKGLDKSGVNMPSFAGMGASFGAEPEPEPVETEDERTDRELGENELAILDLQAQIRGCLVRLSLGNNMQGLWDTEGCLIDLQARIRGDWARQVIGFRLEMARFGTQLQAASRGFLVRRKQQQNEASWHRQADKVVKLQSLFRASRARADYRWIKSKARHHESGIRQFQAAVRGASERKRVENQGREVRHTQRNVEKVQAGIRGMLERRRLHDQIAQLHAFERRFVAVQALARAKILRDDQKRQLQRLESYKSLWQTLQATSRGLHSRRQVASTRNDLSAHAATLTRVQAVIRANVARQAVAQTKSSLALVEEKVIGLQAKTRAFLCRKRIEADLIALRDHELRFTLIEATAKSFLYRRRHDAFLQALKATSPQITQLQSLTRAMLLRLQVGSTLTELDAVEESVEDLQAMARGMLIRGKFAEKKRFFNENMQRVVKVQSYVRAKIQGEAYKSLTSGKNPPVGTVKNFVHLLNDSDFDFDEEVEFERLRKTVVQHVRQNEMADQYIQQLDIKIALLVKNKITLDEVVKHQKHFGGSMGSLTSSGDLSSKDPFDLKALNKTSRRKLERYQELFFILQTQPQYLARQFRRAREQTTPEKDVERMRHLIMGLFGYAQKRREEYYLLKLISRSLKEEIDCCRSVQEYLRGSFLCGKLFGAYVKSPKDRKFMRDTIGHVLKEHIIDNLELDLESDPLHIYHKAIENEQLRTGQRSQRRLNIPREEAIKDPETKKLFITHLQDLRDLVDLVFSSLEDMLNKMPFGVRYIAQQAYSHLTTHFQHEDPRYMLQLAGQWVWKNYLQPALLEPEKYGATDRALQGEQKKNVSEVAKVLNQIAMGRLFGAEDIFLQPLNAYISESIVRLTEFWNNVLDVPNAEAQFDIDEFNDLYAKTKPTLYIKMADIIAIHQLVAAEVSHICTAPDDMLRDVIGELGSVKGNETELMSVSTAEICLTLNPKLHDMEDPDAEAKALFMETKRCILYIIRVQSGANLLEIIIKPIMPEDEERWQMLVRDELSANSRKRGAYSENTLVDIASMNYSELKRTALENILQLEQMGRLSRHNHYQDILNVIAVDIRTKHRRRVQRQRELEGVKLTLGRLNDQAGYLDQQLKTYNDYIEQAMVTLQNKKGKKRFLMPFTKQWEHERELQRSGKVPKFGSFKYSAQELANRGILVAWHGVGEHQWLQHDLTISSNEVGVFTIDGSTGSISIPGASAQLPLDDLLQAQYNGTQFLEFFGGEKIKVNVNLFLHLIMRKFYKDKDK